MSNGFDQKTREMFVYIDFNRIGAPPSTGSQQDSNQR